MLDRRSKYLFCHFIINVYIELYNYIDVRIYVR
jgi:hypothetical protein